jgi:1-deoxy-D-xylulose-5-phosphate synthase
MVATAAAYNDGPIAFRYPRGEGTGVELPAQGEILEIGKGRIVYTLESSSRRKPGSGNSAPDSQPDPVLQRDDNSVAILSYGTRLTESLKAAKLLEEKGKRVTVADARFAKPLDESLIRTLAENHASLITIEEGSIGGFGSYVLDFLNRENLLSRCRVKNLYLPDIFQDHDDPLRQYETAGLTARDIITAIFK